MNKVLLVLVVIVIAVAGRLLYLSDETNDSARETVPVITVMDILNATDLEAGIKQGVRDNDDTTIDAWLKKAQDVAREAELSEQDQAWLASQQARDYVIFNAKRALFNEAFEARFVGLEGIEDLKAAYPEAKNLFAKADSLLKKRDKIIYSIATTLANGEAPTADEIEQAKAVWRERYKQVNPELLPDAS
ncbi:hypothetical protein [Alteromonas sp. CYL-A6]|uniref:hypothetical protein n=1 Tax=Alteromonas nitratireducens TaxID=3390813 RepID=UPI0034B326B8